MPELSRTYRVLCVFIGIGFLFFGVLGLKWGLGNNRAGYPFSGLMAALLIGGLALIWAFLVRPLLRKDDKAAPRAKSVREERRTDMWAIWGLCVFLGLLGTWVSWTTWSSALVIEVVAVLYALLLLWGLWCLFMKDRAIFFAAFVMSALSVMAVLCCEVAMVSAHHADGDPWLAAMIAGAMSISGGIWAWFCRDGNAWRARFNEGTGVLYVGVVIEPARDDKARVGRRWNRRLVGLASGLGATGALLGVATARSLSVLDSVWYWLPATGFAIGCACFSFLITLSSFQLFMLWKWQRSCGRVAHVAGCPQWLSDPQDG
jgi:hypothetical protein